MYIFGYKIWISRVKVIWRERGNPRGGATNFSRTFVTHKSKLLSKSTARRELVKRLCCFVQCLFFFQSSFARGQEIWSKIHKTLTWHVRPTTIQSMPIPLFCQESGVSKALSCPCTVLFKGHFSFSEFWQFHLTRGPKCFNLMYISQYSQEPFLRYGTPDTPFWGKINFFLQSS